MLSSLIAADINGEPSYEDVRSLIHRALTHGLELYGPEGPWVVECTRTDAIVNRGGRHFRYPYTLNEAQDAVELGEPVEVRLSWRDTNGALAARDIEAGTLAFATDLRGLTFAEGDGPVRIEVCRDGEWQHASYGTIKVTPEMRESFVRNFRENVREVGDLPLDYDHEAGPAPGWITGLVNVGQSLFAEVSLTPTGRQKVRDGEYRFFSPEWHPNWKNPRTGDVHGPTLFGGALTNKPFFRGMKAICCSEAPASAAGLTAGDPGKEIQSMSAATQTSGTQTETDAPDREQQFTEMRTRITGLEAELATLRAKEARTAVESRLSGLRFNEGRLALAPAARDGLTEAILGITNVEQRQRVLEAVSAVQFAELGERGFVVEEAPTGALTAAEERDLREMAERNGLAFDEVKTAFLDVRRRR